MRERERERERRRERDTQGVQRSETDPDLETETEKCSQKGVKMGVYWRNLHLVFRQTKKLVLYARVGDVRIIKYVEQGMGDVKFQKSDISEMYSIVLSKI